jgi:PAS domain S-box-containing protein
MPWHGVSSDLIRPLAAALSSVVVPVLFAGGIHLVERRGRKEQLDPKRQVEISTLLESIPEAAIIVDSNGRIVDANSTAANLVGKTREQLRGLAAEEIGQLLENPEGKHEPIVRRALAGQTVRHERRMLRNTESGAVHELLISANPILDVQGHTIASLLIARDVTELTQLQRRIGEIERHQAIGQVAAALAHDFNNILDTIGQSAALLQMNMDRPASERKPLLDMIQNTVHRGAEMVQQIREYIRTGQGAVRPLNVCDIIRQAVELTRPLWQKSNVTVNARLEPVPYVNANAVDLRRVFTNLIINAIEAMPNGGKIDLTCEPRNGSVVATISDTGVGMPPESQKKIFFPYFTTKPRGTGLGLSGAQKILLSYGGNISFQSDVGKGTTFTIALPAANATAQASDRSPKPSLGRS